ncbi:NAD(P)/FAD-dependent oxidoreductase [Marinomonas transparens]|uniref:NAD(P)/FAD-dependent oxidoreductase n=1 Tax=Marinomonas transparens TaxID=2795388 RepID=A0A934JPY4_9GAMM|nr:FAD/NAD(P)-binding oxidoreductase [Marinomonas transparens]MBJ7536076.1 NAD(P)/FAD-dependent oxidoreductase [Marinomonas transparens]
MTPQNIKEKSYDLIIIGAGPAGMSAATTAATKGLSVAILDEQTSPGGQIYRAIKYSPLNNPKILGKDYYTGKDLLQPFEKSQVSYFSNSVVWSIDEKNQVAFSYHGKSQLFRAKKILIASGAIERPVPFPGWTLPGVMTCGAAQILLKTSGLTPKTPLVLAGSGPLMLLIAVQLMKAGVTISAILDTTPKGQLWRALPHFANALKNLPLLYKGMGLLWTLKKSGIRFIKHVKELKAIEGIDGQLTGVIASTKNAMVQLDCQSLLVHQGVVPNVQLSRALGLDHKWNNLQVCWKPVVDAWGESSRKDIFIAGDGSGIAGAIAAKWQGKLSALKIAQQVKNLGDGEVESEVKQANKSLNKQQAIRPFLDQLYQPAQTFLTPPDDTIVCRCEEVSAGEIRQIAKQGCKGPNQAKAFCRAGMGPCQGRLCGLTVSNLIAQTNQVSQEQVGYYHIRMPIKPLTINELADLSD